MTDQPAAGYAQFSEDFSIARQVLSSDSAALVIVDVQNDYCDPDGALGAAGFDMSSIDPMCDVIDSLISVARETGVPIVFVRVSHSERTDTPAWKRKSKHQMAICIEGSWGAEFYRVVPEDGDPVVTKHRYSAFIGTNLAQVLGALQRTTVVLTGTATNVCVESTARDACMLDYDVIIVEDGVAATDPVAHAGTLQNLDRFFGHVVPSDLVSAVWRGDE